MNCKNLLRLKFVKGEFVMNCQRKISFAVNFLNTLKLTIHLRSKIET